ncbi:transcription antiterminator BlgG [Paracoccus sp. MA]|uniref:transcription antiterminator BlgG n=1 Tax=Paracoccus sp. MA TaxID=2895796 RepID=UPI001E4B3C7E|nr:transcription antiterminator BlgG [Paracoccus sp. MA]UFM66448.1 transcription antiterminator BlgG [Paracoccus sp. MA]
MTPLPHHTPIRALHVSPEAGQKLRAEAGRMPACRLTGRQLADLQLLVSGGFAPLRGFLTRADHDAVLDRMRLASGTLWPVPVVLDVGADFAGTVEPGEDIALCDPQGAVMAILSLTDKWHPDKTREAESLFGTADPAHPGVAWLQREVGPVYLGGPVKGLDAAGDIGRGPNGLRADFRQRGCPRVLACDPADEAAAGHAARRIEAELLATAGAPTRHAGAREALWQALIRRNHGATHLLAPRDPAALALLRDHCEELGLTLVGPEAGEDAAS